MKNIKKFILTSLISLSFLQQTNAAVAGITIFFNPILAGQIAISGLAVTGAGTLSTVIWPSDKCENGTCFAGLVVGIIVGLIALDDNSKLQFKSLDKSQATKLKIIEADRLTYNTQIEEVNFIFDEVLSQVSTQNTPQEVRSLWSNYSDLIDKSTFNIMQKIVTEM